MEYLTLAEIKQKIVAETDTEGEDFVQDDELLGYINDGIDICEAKIHNICEDYFLAKSTIDLVQGTEEYSLPSNIYANKIRSLIYKNGDTIYEVRRSRMKNRFLMMEIARQFDPSEDYSYIMVNSSGASKPKILLTPPSRESLTGGLIIWHIRNANKLVNDTDTCDVPEFVDYVIQFAKVKIMRKEGHPNLADEEGVLDKYEQIMVDTLSDMVPDGDNTVEMDLSFYEEMS